jgi:hypothetical protein
MNRMESDVEKILALPRVPPPGTRAFKAARWRRFYQRAAESRLGLRRAVCECILTFALSVIHVPSIIYSAKSALNFSMA